MQRFLFLRMKNFYFIIFPFLFIAFTSCDKKTSISDNGKIDSAYFYFSIIPPKIRTVI